MNETVTLLENKLKHKNEELEQFIYIVSHDVKAPLRAINNLVGWIEDEIGDYDNNVTEYFKLLKGRVNRIDSMMNALTELSRVRRLELEHTETNVGKLIQDIIDIIPDKKNISIEIDKMPVFRTMQSKLFKVLYALIHNAFRFHTNDKNGWIKIKCTENTDSYLFEIIDNGPGIEVQYHQKVFSVFYTLNSKDVSETTGAGLTIASAIVDFAGSKLNLESNPGQGSNFNFLWPKSEILLKN